MMPFQDKILPYFVIGIAEIFTWIPLTLFSFFLFFGPFEIFNFGFTNHTTLFFNAFLSITFAIQHSVMTRKFFHTCLEHWVPAAFYRALFATISGFTLLLVVLLWQASNYTIIIINGFFRWMLHGAFAFSLLGFLWAGLVLKGLDTSGTKAIMQYLQREKQPLPEFTISGPYRWVRHPLYFFSLLMIWSFPDITSDRLLFNFLWSGWIVVGAYLEEKDLVKTFGDPYRQYQKQVSMLIPHPFKRFFTSTP